MVQTKSVKFWQFIKKFDMYGTPVNFTLDKQQTYKTSLGAAISIFCILAMGCFTIIQTIKLVNKDDPILSMSILTNQRESLDLGALGFMFAVQNIDPRVGKM